MTDKDKDKDGREEQQGGGTMTTITPTEPMTAMDNQAPAQPCEPLFVSILFLSLHFIVTS
jgi:hypothetical protein